MPAEFEQQILTARKSVHQIDAGDTPPAALAGFTLKRNQNGGQPVFFRQPGGHNANHPLVPVI